MTSAVRACAFAFAAMVPAACAGANDSDPQAAIRLFAGAEDDGFAAARGAYRGHRSGLQYYESFLALPGASSCAIYTSANRKDVFGTCDFLESTPAEALRTFDDWSAYTQAALPQWRGVRLSPPPPGDLAAYQSADASGHAVYVYVTKAEAAGYRVTETFGTKDAFAAR